jgi:putative transposase
VKIHKTYKQKLLLTPEQSKLCRISAGIVRKLYNAALEQRKLAYSICRKSLSYEDQANELKELKTLFPYIKLAPSQSIQQGLLDLKKAFTYFFKGIAGFPTFRRKGINDSFRLPSPKDFRITRHSKKMGSINLPKLGRIKFRWTRDIQGIPKFATVSIQADGYYISITCLQEFDAPQNDGPTIGLDRGCNVSIATSDPLDAQYLHNMPFKSIKILEDKIKGYQKKLSSKVKRSKGYYKHKNKISKLYRKLCYQRHDFLHKITTKIAKNHSYIFIEDLDVKKMTKSNKGSLDSPGTDVKRKSGLNKAILRQAWGYAKIYLDYKSKWYGSQVGLVPAPYTSQKCNRCKFIHPLNRVGEKFLCRRCMHLTHADINAAKNIKEAGQALFACETSYTSSQEPPKISVLR